MDQDHKNPFISVHVPIALVALALSALFFGQIKGVGTATETMKFQRDTADKQIALLKDNREKLAKAMEDRAPLVKQSEELQKTFTEMMKDVNAIADKDEEAKKIILGYGIKIADNPAGGSEAKKDK